jgi:hypothetical protein
LVLNVRGDSDLTCSRSPISAGCPFKELRVICGTRGDPDTVAPFRAWRGSRDLVAQSPKLHERAVAKSDERECEFSLAHRCEGNGRAAVRVVLKILRRRAVFCAGAIQQRFVMNKSRVNAMTRLGRRRGPTSPRESDRLCTWRCTSDCPSRLSGLRCVRRRTDRSARSAIWRRR